MNLNGFGSNWPEIFIKPCGVPKPRLALWRYILLLTSMFIAVYPHISYMVKP